MSHTIAPPAAHSISSTLVPTVAPDPRSSASRPVGGAEIVGELAALAGSGDYSMILRRSAEVAARAGRSPRPDQLADALAGFAATGSLPALLAIESLVNVQHRAASEALVALLSHRRQIVRRHAAWRLAERTSIGEAIPTLLDMVTVGGIDTMHAHRTLQRWAGSINHQIARPAIARMIAETDPIRRARLVDLLAVLGPDTDGVLLHVAQNVAEPDGVRSAAIGALGERSCPRIESTLNVLAAADSSLSADAALALTGSGHGQSSPLETGAGQGVRVAQLVLAGGLDGQLSLGGRGDTGGVASLLVSLGESLAHRAEVDHVLTIGRGSVTDAVTGPLSSSRIPLTYGMIALGDDLRPATAPGEVWEHLPSVERGLRRVLRLAGPVDVLHLRMADVGTLVGAEVAGAAGIPVCFSVAPDPHNVIESLQSRGELDDESFLQLATETHVWFRARLIEGVSRQADQLALFPRSKPTELLAELGVEPDAARQRVSVVAEGIDISLLDRAAEQSQPSATSAVLGDVLDDLTARIPESRRHLPLVLSVGRLNPVKGMDRVVSAWASDEHLCQACNLVIVGGDLDDPSDVELEVLAAIDHELPVGDVRRDGLVLLGGRPRADVARLLVATAAGRDGGWAGGGVYVDGALKEEFGLAVLEAMAAGLVVVAPSTGGPSTYVEHGETGVLVDPSDDLATGITEAFGLVRRYGRAERARGLVEDRYSIDTMAAQLVDLYQPEMASR